MEWRRSAEIGLVNAYSLSLGILKQAALGKIRMRRWRIMGWNETDNSRRYRGNKREENRMHIKIPSSSFPGAAAVPSPTGDVNVCRPGMPQIVVIYGQKK